MKKMLERLWRRVRGLFASEVMVGGRLTPPPAPLNRKQRRVIESLNRRKPK
jgi:hypothetical protein